MVYREVEDKNAECTALLLTCNLYLQSRRFQEMQEPANDALFIAQDQGFTDLEKNAQEYLDQIQQMMVQTQQQQQQMMMPQQGGPGGPAVPVWLQQQGGGEGGPQDSGPGSVAKTRQRGDVLDVKAGVLDISVIKNKIQTISANIMGFDDVAELEMDSPFMESGLTISSSVLLRDELMAEMQGVSLPITLVFDYPSPNAVADFIAEKAG